MCLAVAKTQGSKRFGPDQLVLGTLRELLRVIKAVDALQSKSGSGNVASVVERVLTVPHKHNLRVHRQSERRIDSAKVQQACLSNVLTYYTCLNREMGVSGTCD